MLINCKRRCYFCKKKHLKQDQFGFIQSLFFLLVKENTEGVSSFQP